MFKACLNIFTKFVLKINFNFSLTKIVHVKLDLMRLTIVSWLCFMVTQLGPDSNQCPQLNGTADRKILYMEQG